MTQTLSLASLLMPMAAFPAMRSSGVIPPARSRVFPPPPPPRLCRRSPRYRTHRLHHPQVHCHHPPHCHHPLRPQCNHACRPLSPPPPPPRLTPPPHLHATLVRRRRANCRLHRQFRSQRRQPHPSHSRHPSHPHRLHMRRPPPPPPHTQLHHQSHPHRVGRVDTLTIPLNHYPAVVKKTKAVVAEKIEEKSLLFFAKCQCTTLTSLTRHTLTTMTRTIHQVSAKSEVRILPTQPPSILGPPATPLNPALALSHPTQRSLILRALPLMCLMNPMGLLMIVVLLPHRLVVALKSVVVTVAAVAEAITLARKRLPITLIPCPIHLPAYTLPSARKVRVFQKRNKTNNNTLIAAPHAKQILSMISSAFYLPIVCPWYIFLMVFVIILMTLRQWPR